MTREEIAIRHEIRQMLNEAGFNQDGLRQIVHEEVERLLDKHTKSTIDEISYTTISDIIRRIVVHEFKAEIQRQVCSMLYNKQIQITIL